MCEDKNFILISLWKLMHVSSKHAVLMCEKMSLVLVA